MAVDDALPDMLAFLVEDFYVDVPLETTYAASWSYFPADLKPLLG